MQEANERQDWERTRWATTVLLNIQIEKNKRIKPTDLLPLPWDSETVGAAKAAGQKLMDEKLRAKLAKQDEAVRNLPSKPRRNGI